ncbi:MAG: AsnC family transcriptional regulator [Desulfurococcales archaeon]|nr:AsnC family transcriptional regulator [Desulfurococcales archaeon]
MGGRKTREIYDRLSYSFIEIIEKIQETQGLPTITGLAEDMGLHVSTLWRRIKTLHDYDVAFTADINYTGLGIKRLVVYSKRTLKGGFNELPYLEYLIPLIPRGTILQFEVTQDKINYLLNNLSFKVPRDSEVYIFDYYYHSKPNLRAFYDIMERKVKPRWDYLLDSIRAAEFHRVPLPKRNVKYDEIDLFILEQLQGNPFISMREIAKKLQEAVASKKWAIQPIYSNVTYSRVRRHFVNHIVGKGMVTGVHIKLKHPHNNMELIAMYSTEDGIAHKVTSAFSEHPYTRYGLVSNEGDRGLVRISVPAMYIRGLLDILDKLLGANIIREWDAFIIDSYHVTEKKVSFKNYI